MPAIACALAGCGPGGVCGGATDYPAPLEGATAVVHVAGSCGGAGADGSAERPFATISEALAAAPLGASVVIAPGVYSENVVIAQDVALIGSSTAGAPTDGLILLQAPSDHGLRVTGGQNVLLRGVRVDGATGTGIWVSGGASVTIEASTVAETQKDAQGEFGFGLLASDGAAILLQRSAITGAEGIAVLVSSAGGILLQNEITDNAGAGIRLESALGEVRLEENHIERNTGLGVGVFSSRAILLQNVIKDTAAAGASATGDGILVAGLSGPGGEDLGSSFVTIADNTVSGNGRVGILASGAAAKGILLQNNQIDGNGFGAAFGAGVWLQMGAGSDPASVIEGNTLQANRFVGLGVRGDTQGILLQNNGVFGTVLGDYIDGGATVAMGDGLHLLAGASAQILSNTFQQNARFGLVLDAAGGAMTTISGNQITDNDQYGILLQNQPVVPSTVGNTFSGNGSGDVEANPPMPYGLYDEDLATMP